MTATIARPTTSGYIRDSVAYQLRNGLVAASSAAHSATRLPNNRPAHHHATGTTASEISNDMMCVDTCVAPKARSQKCRIT